MFVILLHLGLALAAAVPDSANLLGRDTSSEESFIVNTGYAKFLGNFTPPFSVAYLGVPYAEPPVGNLRFRSPADLDVEKIRETGGVIDARSYPDFCVQGSIGEGDAGGAGSEDCLKVNIYTPVNATADSKRKSLWNHQGTGANVTPSQCQSFSIFTEAVSSNLQPSSVG